jgi:hypothetical protein
MTPTYRGRAGAGRFFQSGATTSTSTQSGWT